MNLAPGQTIRRRNTLLQIQKRDAVVVVDKTYTREYSATEEESAYREIRTVAEGLEGIRVANVLEVATGRNAIVVEYVDGFNLRQYLAMHGLRRLAESRPSLVELFVRSRRAGIRFDADPTNFIVVPDGNELVIIDPACRPVEIPDYCFVAFVFGLLKLGLRSPLRCNWLRLTGALKPYYHAYCAGVDEPTTVGSLHRQMAELLSCVIGWNRLAVESESVTQRLLRRLVVIPALHMFRLALLVAAKVKK